MTTEFDLDVSVRGVETFLEDPAGPVAEHVRITTQRVLRLIQFYCPVGKTGRLRDSWESTDVGNGWVIHSDVEYAIFVVSGTPPHLIRARGRALAWDDDGSTAFAAWVMHPGTRPNNFVLDALRDGVG